MNARRTTWWAFLLLLLSNLALSAGCAHQFPDYPATPAENCDAHVTAGNVSLGAEPIFDSGTSQEYFEADMVSKGILPVYVVIENQTPDQTFVVSSGDFELAGYQPATEKNDVASPTPGAVAAYVGAFAGSVPILLVGAAFAVDAQNVQTNFNRKAIQEQTIGPRESASGFVFFSIPSSRSQRPKQWQLRALLKEIHQSPTAPIDVVFTEPGR